MHGPPRAASCCFLRLCACRCLMAAPRCFFWNFLVAFDTLPIVMGWCAAIELHLLASATVDHVAMMALAHETSGAGLGERATRAAQLATGDFGCTTLAAAQSKEKQVLSPGSTTHFTLWVRIGIILVNQVLSVPNQQLASCVGTPKPSCSFCKCRLSKAVGHHNTALMVPTAYVTCIRFSLNDGWLR